MVPQDPRRGLSSVSILTTGFDEPTVETIILNRAPNPSPSTTK